MRVAHSSPRVRSEFRRLDRTRRVSLDDGAPRSTVPPIGFSPGPECREWERGWNGPPSAKACKRKGRPTSAGQALLVRSLLLLRSPSRRGRSACSQRPATGRPCGSFRRPALASASPERRRSSHRPRRLNPASRRGAPRSTAWESWIGTARRTAIAVESLHDRGQHRRTPALLNASTGDQAVPRQVVLRVDERQAGRLRGVGSRADRSSGADGDTASRRGGVRLRDLDRRKVLRRQGHDWGQDLRFYVNVLAWANGKRVPDMVDGWRWVHFKAGEKLDPQSAVRLGFEGQGELRLALRTRHSMRSALPGSSSASAS